VAGGARGAVDQSSLAQGYAMSTLQEVMHKALALFPVNPAIVAGATSLWLIQWMGLGTDFLTLHNVVIPVTGNTAYCLGFSSDLGISVYTAIELFLCFAVAARAIDLG